MIRALVAGALALAGSAAAAAGPEAQLVRMSEAARTANYQGVMIYQTQDRLETLRVIHGVNDGVEMERVQTLTGAPREVLKKNGRVVCLLPKERRVTVEMPTPNGLFPALTAERAAQLAAIYQFQSIGEARVAGRNCTGISIIPRDRYRYGYQIWADAETHVPLKVNLLARDGSVLEQMMFTEVDFPAHIPDTAFQVEGETRDPRSLPPTIVRAGPPPEVAEPATAADMQLMRRFRELPPGFRVTMRSVRPTADGQGTVEHILLTDGLSAISVFSTRRKAPAQTFQGQSRMGAVHAFGRMLGTMHITVVGEAPPETVRLIGENVEPAEMEPADADAAEPTPVSAPQR